jgi:hypothetical protein
MSSESSYQPNSLSTPGLQLQETPQINASIDLVKCILAMDQTKRPITTAELAKVYGHKINKELLNDARVRLRTVFGMELDAIEGKNNAFYLIKTHPRKNRVAIRPKATDLHDSFLTLILGFIMMQKKDSWMQYHEIEDFICRSNIRLDRKVYNGISEMTVRDLIKKEWVYQGYFMTRKNPTDEGNERKVEYRWGSRARAEFDRMNMLTLMAKIMKSKATDWKEQYNMVLREEDPDEAAAVARAKEVQAEAATKRVSLNQSSQGLSQNSPQVRNNNLLSQRTASNKSSQRTSQMASQTRPPPSRVLRERQSSAEDEVDFVDDDGPSTSTGIRRSSRP